MTALQRAAIAALMFSCAGCLSTPFRVTEVAPGIFEGQRPSSRADYQVLREHGVRTILSLEVPPWNLIQGSREASQEGFAYRDAPVLPSPLEPSEHGIREALLTLRDPSLQPIFVHCYLGRDRVALIVGLYRIYYLGWTPEEAWNDMLRTGFKLRWTLRGLRTYFWSHTQTPDWAKSGGQPSASRQRYRRTPGDTIRPPPSPFG